MKIKKKVALSGLLLCCAITAKAQKVKSIRPVVCRRFSNRVGTKVATGYGSFHRRIDE